MPSTDIDTETDLDRLTSAMTKLVGYAFGPDAATQLWAVFADGNAWMTAPSTMTDQMRNLAESVAPIDNESFDRIAGPIMRQLDPVIRRAYAHPLWQRPPVLELHRFLDAQQPYLNRPKWEALMEDACVTVLIPASIAPLKLAEPASAFEPAARQAADYLRRAIESWYRPLIRLLVETTHASRGTAIPSGLRRHAPLGRWMTEARSLWDYRCGPMAVLDQKLLDTRNALTHEELILDIRKETVVDPCDPTRTLSRQQMASFVMRQFAKLWLLMLAGTAWIPPPHSTDA